MTPDRVSRHGAYYGFAPCFFFHIYSYGFSKGFVKNYI